MGSVTDVRPSTFAYLDAMIEMVFEIYPQLRFHILAVEPPIAIPDALL